MWVNNRTCEYDHIHACPTNKGPQPCEEKKGGHEKRGSTAPISNKGF